MADQSTSGKTGPTRDKSFIKDSGNTHQIQLNIKKESGTKNIPSQKATKAARKESQLKVSVPSTSENRSKSLSTKGNDLPSKKFKNNGYEGENITSFRLTIPISNSSKMKSPIKIARAKDQMKDIKGKNPMTSSSEVSKHRSKLDNQGGKSNTPDHTPPVPVFARQRSFADVVKTSPHQNTDTVLAKLTIPTGKATLSGETEENGQVNTTSLTYPEGKMKNEMEDGLAADIAVPQPSSDFLPVTRNNLDLKKEEQKTAEDILKNDQKPIFRQRSFAEVVRLPPQTEKIASILKTQNTALVSKSSQYEKPILQKVSRGNNFLKNTVFGMKNDMYQNNAYAEEEKRANSQLRTDDFINCTKEQDATLNKESDSRIPPQIQNHTKSMAKSFPVLKTGDTKIVLRSRSDIIRPQIVDSKFINKDLKRTNIVSTNDSAVSEASKKSAAELMKEVTQKRKNMLENKNRVDAKSILETTSKELVRTPERHIGEQFLQQSVKMDTKLSKVTRANSNIHISKNKCKAGIRSKSILGNNLGANSCNWRARPCGGESNERFPGNTQSPQKNQKKDEKCYPEHVEAAALPPNLESHDNTGKQSRPSSVACDDAKTITDGFNGTKPSKSGESVEKESVNLTAIYNKIADAENSLKSKIMQLNYPEVQSDDEVINKITEQTYISDTKNIASHDLEDINRAEAKEKTLVLPDTTYKAVKNIQWPKPKGKKICSDVFQNLCQNISCSDSFMKIRQLRKTPIHGSDDITKQPRKERSFVGYTNGNYKQKRTNQSMANAKVSGKPSLELYKPPSMRTSDTDNMPNEADFSHNGGAQRSKSGANIDKGSILVRSNTSTHFYKNQMVPYVVPMPILTAPRVHFQPMENINYRQVPPRMMKSKTSLNLYSNQSVIDTSIPPPPLMQPVATTQPVPSLKRSKSVGCGSDLANRKDKEIEFPDLGAMSPEALACLKKVFENPSRASARTIMDGVRHLFTKLVESPKLANVAARLCIAIIEKETGETFYESLMNACQEWYRDRDRLLRSPVGPPGVSNPSPRWVAFICFLHELYLAFKRKGIPLKQDDADPASVILKLLAECCIVSLKVPAVNSLPELERVFVILTGVGRDLETSLPSKMSAVINTIRDSFLDVNVADNAGKTLLQMIELHSARWQLPATAVMYYYPSVTGIS
ncbi:uncharacterized protein LOC136039788 [Artemia franciscana]|uniref:MIF4G domain-containing protein n=1 Tax=Artemia franciscana TaxID=6661 RepID=A0AA88HM64_ARTSF|nr:hypothetical protein QYM36_008791 [Artemia franciscana]